VGIPTAPPVEDLDDDDDNPWADVSDARHVSVDEFLATQVPDSSLEEVFPEVQAPAAPLATPAAAIPAPEPDLDDEEASPTAHASLAALFDDEEEDEDEDDLPPSLSDLERAQAETMPTTRPEEASRTLSADPTSTMLRQHENQAARRARERARSEAKPRASARRHPELAELFEG
jgi:ribosomal protein L12E/L44/L45/RPP1/RPP2